MVRRERFVAGDMRNIVGVIGAEVLMEVRTWKLGGWTKC